MADPIEHPSTRGAAANNPVVIDLGRKRRKLVKRPGARRHSRALRESAAAREPAERHSGERVRDQEPPPFRSKTMAAARRRSSAASSP
jgi:hypothetical protein